jgi:hypothetical protein
MPPTLSIQWKPPSASLIQSAKLIADDPSKATPEDVRRIASVLVSLVESINQQLRSSNQAQRTRLPRRRVR